MTRFISPLYDTTFKYLWKSNSSRLFFIKLIKYLTTIDLTNYVGSMTRMFEGLDLDKIDIICNQNLPTKDYSYCFSKCTFTNFDNINTVLLRMKNAENLSYILSETEIESIDVLKNYYKKQNCILDYAFYKCNNLTNIDNLELVGISSAIGMFQGCENITSAKNMVINFFKKLQKIAPNTNFN